MKPLTAFAVLGLVLSIFVGTGMALGTTSYATAPVANGYGIPAAD